MVVMARRVGFTIIRGCVRAYEGHGWNDTDPPPTHLVGRIAMLVISEKKIGAAGSGWTVHPKRMRAQSTLYAS